MHTILTLQKLHTKEDEHDQEVLTEILSADKYAPDIVVGGPLLSDEASLTRLEEACSALSGEALCNCCEAFLEATWARQRAAYFVGLATGLRLARATDGGAS